MGTKISELLRAAMAGLSGLVLIGALVLPASAAQGHQGLQGGWAIDDLGHMNFPHSVLSELPYMQQAGAGVVRLNFRLGACFNDWTSAGCSTADGPTALAVYDQIVNAAITTYHLQVVGLLSSEAWHGTQDQWNANNAENLAGSGDNPYIQAYARSAAGVLAGHYVGKVTTWEVWNEPNAWTTNPSPGVYVGSSYMYPSNFAWLLKRSYAAIKSFQPGKTSVVVSGGLFGHDAGGAAMLVTDASGATARVTKRGTSSVAGAAAATCPSVVPSGADHLCNTYRMGQQKAGWKANAYPLDAIGQHLYIDQGRTTTTANITSYLRDVRSAYVRFEGSATAKKTEITEFGWVANPSSTTYTADAANQAQNVQTAYTTFRSTTYVSRADYFAAQDVPEGSVFYGLVAGDGVLFKPAFTSYQTYAAY